MSLVTQKEKNIPRLGYYNDLLNGAAFVISPLSTMLLEAVFCKKPALAIVYETDFYFTSPKRNFENYQHLNELYNFRYMRLVHKQEELKLFINELSSSKVFTGPNDADWFIHSNGSFESNLLNSIEEM